MRGGIDTLGLDGFLKEIIVKYVALTTERASVNLRWPDHQGTMGIGAHNSINYKLSDFPTTISSIITSYWYKTMGYYNTLRLKSLHHGNAIDWCSLCIILAFWVCSEDLNSQEHKHSYTLLFSFLRTASLVFFTWVEDVWFLILLSLSIIVIWARICLLDHQSVEAWKYNPGCSRWFLYIHHAMDSSSVLKV